MFKESFRPFKGKRKIQYKIILPSTVIESVSIKKTYIISGSLLLYIKRSGAMQSGWYRNTVERESIEV